MGWRWARFLFLKDSFTFSFMEKKNMKIWRWQEENGVEVEELECSKMNEWRRQNRCQNHTEQSLGGTEIQSNSWDRLW